MENTSGSMVNRHRTIYLDSIFNVLLKAHLSNAVTVQINCTVKDLKVLNELKARKAFITNSQANLVCESTDANTSVTIAVTKSL